MLELTLNDRTTNGWIRQTTKRADVVEKTAKFKWSYAEPVARGSANKWHKRILT